MTTEVEDNTVRRFGVVGELPSVGDDGVTGWLVRGLGGQRPNVFRISVQLRHVVERVANRFGIAQALLQGCVGSGIWLL